MHLPRRHVLALALSLAACSAAQAAETAVPTGPLPRTVVPSLVQLELKIDPKQAGMSGSTHIQADIAEATDTVWMHGRGLTIRKAQAVVGKKAIPLTVSEVDPSGVLKLVAKSPLPAGKARIDLDFDAPFGQLQGAYKVRPDGRDYVMTQMEPLGARTAFPSFDEPSFKQPWEVTLVVPQDDVAVANALEAKTENLPGGWKKVTFNRTEALPSYLVAFAVGPWDVVAGPDIAPNGERATPIRLRGVAANGQGGKMKYSLAHTPEIVTALENYFGIPYPFDKLDNLAAPDFWAGAMENAGLIAYRDSLMFPDETSSVGRRQSFF
jgi:alanyl aminopeptidase